jgi:3-oxoacyl-[acyl-carrier protein] reductase
MIKQKHGKIVNISSVVAHTGNKGQVNYSASKAGLIAMTKNMALEYASRGITANCISPGFIDTKMTNTISDDAQKELLKKIPLNRYGKPEDVAQVALFLASSMSNYITGETINVNGGMYMS